MQESCQEQPEDIEYHCSGLSVRILHKITSEVSQDVIRWATDLTRNNMSALYDETWGWSTKSKLKELGHVCTRRPSFHRSCQHLMVTASSLQARAHHLIAYPDNPVPTRPVAYLHYRWEQDPPKEERRKGQPVFPVAYVYELQLTEEARGKGLGSYMMSLVEATVRSASTVNLAWLYRGAALGRARWSASHPPHRGRS